MKILWTLLLIGASLLSSCASSTPGAVEEGVRRCSPSSVRLCQGLRHLGRIETL